MGGANSEIRGPGFTVRILVGYSSVGFFFRSCLVQDGNSSSLSSAAVEGGIWSTAATKPDN